METPCEHMDNPGATKLGNLGHLQKNQPVKLGGPLVNGLSWNHFTEKMYSFAML